MPNHEQSSRVRDDFVRFCLGQFKLAFVIFFFDIDLPPSKLGLAKAASCCMVRKMRCVSASFLFPTRYMMYLSSPAHHLSTGWKITIPTMTMKKGSANCLHANDPYSFSLSRWWTG